MRSAAFLALLVTAGGSPAQEAKVELTKDERALLDLINKERAKEKLPSLKPNPVLMKLARDHSANMAKQEKMEHVLDGKTPGDRADDAGYGFQSIGENI